MRIAYSDELELYPASKMQDISQHSHNVKLTLHFYAHIESYVISYGLFRTSCSHNPAKYSHNAKLTLRFYAHNENYVISYGLFRTSCSHNPAQHSHNAKLTLRFYAHIWAGQEVMKPLLCKHIVVSDL